MIVENIMKDYVGINERILEEWRTDYVKKNKPLYPKCQNLGAYFALDGIMNKGEFAPCKNDDGAFFVGRENLAEMKIKCGMRLHSAYYS